MVKASFIFGKSSAACHIAIHFLPASVPPRCRRAHAFPCAEIAINMISKIGYNQRPCLQRQSSSPLYDHSPNSAIHLYMHSIQPKNSSLDPFISSEEVAMRDSAEDTDDDARRHERTNNGLNEDGVLNLAESGFLDPNLAIENLPNHVALLITRYPRLFLE